MAEKLLIVDDETDTLRLVALMLERQGYEVITAENGLAALEKVKTDQPDLVLLDVMMPEMDGFEVAQKLRQDPKTENIPIIMFTAKTQVEDKIAGLESGADVYLTKPTQPRELFAQVKAILARVKKAQSAPSVSKPTDRGYTIGVVSAKGGMGVSSVVTNLGVMLHRRTKESTLVAELRPGYGGISLDLGYSSPEGLTRLLKSQPGDITLQAIELALTSHATGVQFLLASPHPKDALLCHSALENFSVIASHLRLLARYVVLDLGSSLPASSQEIVPVCDEVIVIMEPSPHNVRQTKEMVANLTELGVGEGRIRIVLVNRVRSSVQLNWVQVQEDLGHKIDTIFTPAPELAYQAAIANQPMVLLQPGSITTQQFDKLVALITQQSERA